MKSGHRTNEITTGMVSRMLHNAGVGELVETPTDKMIEKRHAGGQATLKESGTAPTGFNKGKVRKIE